MLQTFSDVKLPCLGAKTRNRLCFCFYGIKIQWFHHGYVTKLADYGPTGKIFLFHDLSVEETNFMSSSLKPQKIIQNNIF